MCDDKRPKIDQVLDELRLLNHQLTKMRADNGTLGAHQRPTAYAGPTAAEQERLHREHEWYVRMRSQIQVKIIDLQNAMGLAGTGVLTKVDRDILRRYGLEE